MTAEHLIADLEGYVQSLRKGWMAPEDVAINLLLVARANSGGRIVRLGELFAVGNEVIFVCDNHGKNPIEIKGFIPKAQPSAECLRTCVESK